MNKLLWALLGIVAVISLLGGLASPHDPAHDVWWNSIPDFFALLGFMGCLLIIFLAKWLGNLFLRKREGYYNAD
ncbi:MAG: hypothetical protein A2Y79_07415 [Deltaproteobacteria bacterium RBG_13_43_22]|nr:MAG: hypothetical protein A2Y79_07415 [Deltaproteobacteria bacterium RBG_13_43_22]